MNRRKVHRFLVRGLIRRRLRVNVADERKLRKKLVRVFELSRERRELIQIFATQFVVGKIRFRVSS